MPVVDADELIVPAVIATLDALDLKPRRTAAAAKLARYYALQIDEATVSGEPKISAWAARNIAPLLLQILESLGGSPAARAAIKRGAGKDKHSAPRCEQALHLQLRKLAPPSIHTSPRP